MRLRLLQTGLITVDDDASPEVLESTGAAANIHEDGTITPDGGKLMVGGAGHADPPTYLQRFR